MNNMVKVSVKDIPEVIEQLEIADKKINELQQENKQLKEQLENKIDLYEDTISYQLGFDKGKKQLKQEILEFIDTLQGGDKQEFIGYGGYELLKILGEKENE